MRVHSKFYLHFEFYCIHCYMIREKDPASFTLLPMGDPAFWAPLLDGVRLPWKGWFPGCRLFHSMLVFTPHSPVVLEKCVSFTPCPHLSLENPSTSQLQERQSLDSWMWLTDYFMETYSGNADLSDFTLDMCYPQRSIMNPISSQGWHCGR